MDLKLTKKLNEIEFSIYRKPTHTDLIINNKSNHPIQQKLAVFYSLIHRATYIPMSKENIEIEINIIKQIAINNGYPSNKEKKKDNYKTIEYIGPITNQISKTLKNNGINIAFKTNNNLSKYINNKKEKVDKINQSGVYKLNCGSCNAIYVGQTGRSFKTRWSEHIKNYNNKSSFTNHIKEQNHQINEENFKILHIQQKSSKLNILESIEIQNHINNPKFNVLNDKEELYTSPIISVICNSNIPPPM